MDQVTISLIASFVAVAIAILSFFRNPAVKPHSSTDISNPSLLPLQLQAYERLVLLTERIALPSLISRTFSSDLSAREMQIVLLENIRQEFDYNASQQIYVSPAAWDAVRHLKDQNMLTINKVANVLKPDSKASELNKLLLDVMMNQQDKDLHSMVLDTLNLEAKKLMKQIA